jgi:5'-methylthioadenosine phosphorylase
MTANKRQKQSISRAEIGVIGGSGFYDLFDNPKEFEIETMFGAPSDRVMLGRINQRRVAFIPRHGRGHVLPPHRIPYKANLWAFKQMGVKRIIAPAAVGSLNALIRPGDFVICDQFINWTKVDRRDDTFYHAEALEGIKHSERVVHFSMAEPYCKELRQVANRAAQKLKIVHHQTGTVVVIEGPRFSTRAESRFFSAQGWDMVNMTVYPEVVLARELGMCYVNIGLVTDWDAGLEGNKNIKSVTTKEVLRVFRQNNQKAKELIYSIIGDIPRTRKCHCDKYLDEAVI